HVSCKSRASCAATEGEKRRRSLCQRNRLSHVPDCNCRAYSRSVARQLRGSFRAATASKRKAATAKENGFQFTNNCGLKTAASIAPANVFIRKSKTIIPMRKLILGCLCQRTKKTAAKISARVSNRTYAMSDKMVRKEIDS